MHRISRVEYGNDIDYIDFFKIISGWEHAVGTESEHDEVNQVSFTEYEYDHPSPIRHYSFKNHLVIILNE